MSAKDFWEVFYSVVPILAVAILVMVLIMAAPSIDQIIWGK